MHFLDMIMKEEERLEHNSAEAVAWEHSQRSRAGRIAPTH